jgi:hypothetical protein
MYDEYGNFYQDPRFDPSQGSWVTTNADAGAEWRPITVGAPVGQYQTINADAGGQYVENTAAQQAAMNAQLEADRQAQLQAAAAYVAANPLSVSGNQIATRYGERDVSLFKPIVKPGEAITGSTPTQLVDPATNMPVFLSDPSNPYSFTYDNTGTPAISGTLEQQAALYRPLENKGVFGTIGGDFLEGIKDPYFRNFAIAAAAMAAAAALAPAAGAAGAGGSTAGGAGATAFPIDFGSTIMTGGELAGGAAGGLGAGSSTAGGFLGGSGDILAGAIGTGGETLGAAAGLSGSTAGGFLGGSGDILAGAAGTGGGSLGGTTLGSVLSAGSNLLSGSTGDLIKGGLAIGGLAVADALKPDQPATTAGGSLTAAQLQALVDAMPSMIGQYSAQAQQAGTGQMGQGYTPAVRQAIAQLFPTFSLPTQGPFYGAGRFGEGYAPNAPIIKV